MKDPAKLRQNLLDQFFDSYDFDLDPATFTKDELLEEFKLMAKGCLELVDEHVELKIELDRKSKKPNTSGFLKKINLQKWDNVTLYRLAILRLNGYSDKPKTIKAYEEGFFDEATMKMEGGSKYRLIPNPLNADVLAETHIYPIDRPKAPYKERLKEIIHKVIVEKLGRELTRAEYDDMNSSFLDDGNMGQVMRKIFFKNQTL